MSETSNSPATVAPAAEAFGDINRGARELGKLHRLDNHDGTWRCWSCDATMPFHASLSCDVCRHLALARERARAARERALGEDDYRWRGMVANMRGDSRLDRDGGARLLETARKLPSFTKERIDRLSAAFDKRFDRAVPAGRFAVEYGGDGRPEYEDDSLDFPR